MCSVHVFLGDFYQAQLYKMCKQSCLSNKYCYKINVNELVGVLKYRFILTLNRGDLRKPIFFQK